MFVLGIVLLILSLIISIVLILFYSKKYKELYKTFYYLAMVELLVLNVVLLIMPIVNNFGNETIRITAMIVNAIFIFLNGECFYLFSKNHVHGRKIFIIICFMIVLEMFFYTEIENNFNYLHKHSFIINKFFEFVFT